MKWCDIYCDESGNSGGNYIDTQQPFYVLAGWLIERNSTYRVENRINDFKKEYFEGAAELKGAKILKSNRGQHLANKLLTELGEARCIPFFIIAEKRYCIAAKMVEAFLDPEHNEFVSSGFSWMNGIKKEIAQLIYNISERSIEKFAQAHNSPSLKTLIDAQQSLITEFDKNGYYKLSNAIRGSRKNMEDILGEETHSMNAMPNKAMHSLNLPIFISFIQLIEKFTRNANVKKVRMFHDETKQFQEAYPEAFSRYANVKKKEAEFVLENGATILSSLKRLQVFEMRNSELSSMIQGADVLASFINLYCTKVMTSSKISPELKKMGKTIIGAILVNDEFKGNGFNDVISSKDFMKKVAIDTGLANEVELSKKDFSSLEDRVSSYITLD